MRTAAQTAFTLIELLLVLVILSLLLTIAIPRYFNSAEKSREAVLRANLALTRQMLDKYYEDNGKYPDSLDKLVAKRYIRAVPQDPMTGSADTWTLVAPDSPELGGVSDIHSGASGHALDGSAFGEW